MIDRFQYLAGLNLPETQIVEFLKDLIGRKKPKKILEIGSGWGVASRAFLEYSDAELWTMDKIRDLSEFDMRTDGFQSRIRRFVGDSTFVLTTLGEEKFDLIYVDGDHRYSGVKQDLNNSWPLLEKGGAILLDDVYHKKNFDGEKLNEDGSLEYGVARALMEFAGLKFINLSVYAIGNGMALYEN